MKGPLQVAADATIHRLADLDHSEQDQQIRHAAYLTMSRQGMSHRAIAEAMQIELALRGLSEAEIRLAGVSHHNIGLALRSLHSADRPATL